AKAAELGMDGLILPDLPMTVYEREYQQLFQQHGLSNVFLVTPQTSESRIRKIDDLSDSFIYVVSSASTTGKQEGFGETHGAYFQRIAEMKLKNPCIVGFGISNHQSYMRANHALDGAIIGSAFIKAIGAGEKLEESIPAFVHHIRQP
ncbi:MAG: tryptophan synthase subunit alpha, partial [Bacteroidota bacterium]